MRIRKLTYLVLFVFLVGTLASFAAEEYRIDPNHSSANFAVKHLLISTVRGRFTKMSGTIILDEADMTKSSVTAVISAASINTDNENRDRHLRSADFFEVEKYPEIKFQSTRVEKAADGFVAVGLLTIKDVSKVIRLPFSFAKGESRGRVKLGADTATTLNRYEYHINYDQTGATVGKEVKVDINIEANKAEAAVAPAAATPAQPKS